MNPLEYLLPQPAFDLSPAQQDEFASVLASTPLGGWIDYRLPTPQWQFLSYICQTQNLVLHGSQNMDLEIVEPRKALDVRAFSDQEAIFATTDGIWVIYFAIVERKNFKLSLFNSCLNIHPSPGQVLGPLYFFSITHAALVQNPWRSGAIYILPRESFEQEPPQQMMGAEIVFPHWDCPAKILENLLPRTESRSVRFINDDQIKEVRREFFVQSFPIISFRPKRLINTKI